MSEPTSEQIGLLIARVRQLPLTDICRQLADLSEYERNAYNAAIMRRAVAEIVGLRVAVRTGYKP